MSNQGWQSSFSLSYSERARRIQVRWQSTSTVWIQTRIPTLWSSSSRVKPPMWRMPSARRPMRATAGGSSISLANRNGTTERLSSPSPNHKGVLLVNTTSFLIATNGRLKWWLHHTLSDLTPEQAIRWRIGQHCDVSLWSAASRRCAQRWLDPCPDACGQHRRDSRYWRLSSTAWLLMMATDTRRLDRRVWPPRYIAIGQEVSGEKGQLTLEPFPCLLLSPRLSAVKQMTLQQFN